MIQLKEVKFEDLKLPSKLYKFRNWRILEHKKILTVPEIYFAPHKSFNDHHEHSLPYDDNIDEDLLYKYFYENAERVDGIKGHLNKDKYAKRMVKETPFHDPVHRQKVEEIFQERLNAEKGIVSLSPNRDNMDLWRNFAHEFRGFAVGLSPEVMFEKGVITCTAGYVDYYDESDPPLSKHLCFSDEERVEEMMKTIFSLPKRFKDENEYRLSKKIENGQRGYSIKSECIDEVILGAYMSEEHQKEIITLVKDRFPATKLLKQHINDEEDTLSYSEIN